MINILFAAPDTRWEEYKDTLPRLLDDIGIKADLRRDHDPENTDYIVYAPNPDLTDFAPYTHTKAVLSLWAGVETIVTNKTLTQPLTRMVDNGLTEGMVEWVIGHTLRHHLGMDTHIVNPNHGWHAVAPPLARNRSVGVLGLGELGTACARALTALNFNVIGWSRREKSLDGIMCQSGAEGLEATLAVSEILILLLPLTSSTQNLLNADRLSRVPKGAVIINPGRGALIDDDALIDALNEGQIGHATLDVFRTEPLPWDHPFWPHENVTVTPHIASETRTETAAQSVAENIRRSEAGEPLLHLVNRSAGY